MEGIFINILAGCATQGVLSMFLWHNNLLGLPARVAHIEKDISEIKLEMREIRTEMREMRSIMIRLNERIDLVVDKIGYSPK